MMLALASPLLILAVLAWAQPASSAPRTPEASRTSGQAYVRIIDWAKTNRFEVRWLKKDEALQLSNRVAKVSLTVDSRETQINGVQVWLLYPVLARNGTLWVARLDVQQTLRPLLSPPKGRAGEKVKTICLDPGHGGKDPGNHVGSNQEKQYTLLLAKEVQSQLGKAGMKTRLTRSSDTFVELPKRAETASRRRADLFVSLHFNAIDSSRSTVQGAEVYCMTPAGANSTNARGEGNGSGSFAGNLQDGRNLFLAYQVQKALTRDLGVTDRGVRRARFAVLRDAPVPAVLVEAGFMSHPTEGKQILTAAYRQKIAHAIVEGVLAYKRAVEQTN